MHLKESKQIFTLKLVNWTQKILMVRLPGFVAYLHITAKITNEKTGMSTFIDLLPHINLVDNYHYARNISLPGNNDDLYLVEFNVLPPTHIELSLHKDWLDNYGKDLMKKQYFKYKHVDFEEIANSSRR